MHATIQLMVDQYGYLTIFAAMLFGIIGLPLPDEFLLFFTGSLTRAGQLHVLALVAAAWAGSCLGMTVNYYLGRTIGIKRISRATRWIHLTEERLKVWSDRFQKYGPFLIPIGFYVAGLRHASPFIAGASKMRFARFVIFAYGGSLLWILLFVMLGRSFGNQWDRVSAFFHHPLWIAVIVAVLVLLYLLKKLITKYLRVLKTKSEEGGGAI